MLAAANEMEVIKSSLHPFWTTAISALILKGGRASPAAHAQAGRGSGLSQGHTETTTIGTVTPSANLEPNLIVVQVLGFGWRGVLGHVENMQAPHRKARRLNRLQ